MWTCGIFLCCHLKIAKQPPETPVLQEVTELVLHIFPHPQQNPNFLFLDFSFMYVCFIEIKTIPNVELFFLLRYTGGVKLKACKASVHWVGLLSLLGFPDDLPFPHQCTIEFILHPGIAVRSSWIYLDQFLISLSFELLGVQRVRMETKSAILFWIM